MIRKLAIVVIFAFFHSSQCSRLRFEQPFGEPLFRNDQPFRNDPGLHAEPFYKREHIFPREPLMQPEPFMQHPGLLRNEPIYGGEPLQPQPPSEEFLPTDQIMQGEPLFRSDILRRDAIMRREPLMRREPFIRTDPLIRNDKIFSPPPVAEPIFRNQPNYQTLIMAPIVPHEPQNLQPAFPLTMGVPTIMNPGMFHPKLIKPQMSQPMINFPRMRFIRKGIRSIQETLPFTTPTIQATQEFPQYNSEQVQFQGTFQNQAPQQENTSEPSQSNAVTVRNVSQMPTPLNLAQMSSIC